MKNFNKSALALAVVGSLVLTGCGGSGSDSETVPSSSSQTITAIDGYLQNAEVYIDANANGKLERSEQGLGPIGQTDVGGKLSISAINFNGNLVIRAVAGQTIDSDSGVVDKTYVLGAPKGSLFVTPFTHLVQTTGITVAQLAEDLGVGESVLAGDYIVQKNSSDTVLADKAKVAHAVARFVVAEAKQGTDEALVNSSLIAAKDAIEAQVESGRDIDLVEVELEQDGSVNGSVPSTALRFEKASLQDKNWSMFRFDDLGDNEQYLVRFGSANEPDAFCIDSEAFGFLGSTIGIQSPGADCSSDITFNVNTEGNLVWHFTDNGKETSREVTMLHRYTEGAYSMFLMVADNGELFWLDNNPELNDPGDYKIGANSTKYSLRDDEPDRGAIDYFFMKSEFTVTGNESYQVSGADESLNSGNLVLTSFYRIDTAVTTFETMPLYVKKGWEPTSDDIVITVENTSVDSEEHWYFPYRTGGELTLVLNYKPSADRESLFVQSGSKALIEKIFVEVQARNSGTQGTD